MNLELALSMMRSGEGELRPIVDYYAETGLERELIPYLDESDVSPTILYVLSELPRVDRRVLEAIKNKIDIGDIIEPGRVWAEEIVFNHS